MLRLQDAAQQAEQGALAGAAWAMQEDPLAARNPQRFDREQRRAARPAEANVAELDHFGRARSDRRVLARLKLALCCPAGVATWASIFMPALRCCSNRTSTC